jgi:hypothetical protein
VALGELLRASLGGESALLVVDGETSARAARELGGAPAELTAATAEAWRRRLGVARLIVLATAAEADGRIAVTLSPWPPAAPIRDTGDADDLDDLAALAARLDGSVRAAWQLRARATQATRLPSGPALRAYAEGLLAHRHGDDATAAARWTEAQRLAPDQPRVASALAEAWAALGRPRAARAAAARASALPRGDGAPPLFPDAAAARDLEAARAALARGDGEAARRRARELAEAAAARGATTLLAASLRLESGACLQLGDVAQARQRAADAVARAGTLGGADEIDALLALGVAQSASGAGGPVADAAAAEGSFMRALALARAQERLDRVARSLGDLAALAARAGRPDAAARWLEELAEAARAAGEPEAEEAARRERETLGR